MISHDTINKIKDEAAIEEVVGDFLQLKKRGARYIGLCPFHNERTPSFTVTPSLNIYKCFGCGAAGDSVNFVMAHEKMNYVEALRYLAAKYKIEIEETALSKEQEEQKSEQEKLFEINAFAQKFFSHQLAETSEGQNIAQTYLKERGISKATIQKFNIGYATPDGNALIRSATASNFSQQQMLSAGLSTERNGQHYDFFRDRIIFPIHNITGKTIAFGGRVLKKQQQPKYLNTPETEVYHKSNSLYGIFQAKSAIRKADECLLTEGYMDVIALSQAGIENAVASSGTSLTPEQIKLIKRQTQNIVLLYDADAAGIKAALRGIDLILEADMNIKIVLLPDGDDPDSYIQKNGAEKFVAFKENEAQDFILFQSKFLLADAKNDPVKKAEALKETVKSIALVPDTFKRSEYIKSCSKIFQTNEQILIAEINKIRRFKILKDSGEPPENLSTSEENSTTSPQIEVVEKLIYIEREMARLLLENAYTDFDEENKIVTLVLAEINANEYQIKDPIAKYIIEQYQSASRNNTLVSTTEFLDAENAAVKEFAFNILNQKDEVSENWEIKHQITFTPKNISAHSDAESILLNFKIELFNKKLIEIDTLVKNPDLKPEDLMQLLQLKIEFSKNKKELAARLGSVVI